MTTEPLFDRSDIELITHSAKINRVKFLFRETGGVRRVARWGALGTVITACLALLAGHGIFSKLS